MDGGAWQVSVHGVTKSRTQLSDFTFTFHFHALEKEMSTYSNVLAWRIPGTGEPGGLPSMGLHRLDTTEVTLQQQQQPLPSLSFEGILFLVRKPSGISEDNDDWFSLVGSSRNPLIPHLGVNFVFP